MSFVDADGLRHSVELHADTLYEAAVLALKVFRDHECPPAPSHPLQVAISTTVTHTVTMKKVEDWLNGNCRSPKERVLKDRLKAIMT